ncbi:hypothetical protein EFM7_2147 [Enterococcus faecalis M7]|nr:hypothetical protein EFM7_2147 [Enterococcus faecalis M7]
MSFSLVYFFACTIHLGHFSLRFKKLIGFFFYLLKPLFL